MQGAAKVGFLIVVFVVLLFGGYAILGKALGRDKPNTIFADFADAGGTSPGTSITMAGVRIGTVKDLQLVSPTHARLTFHIDPEIKVPRGSVARIGGSLIGLGTSPVQIDPPPGPIQGYLANGESIKGIKASALDGVLPEEGRQTLRELNMTLAATRKLMENQSLTTKVEKLLVSSSATLEKFGLLADEAKGVLARANGLVGQNQPAIANAMHSASQAMADIRKSTKLLSQLIESGKYQKESLALLQQLNSTAAKADELMASINNFVNDPKLQGDLKDTAAHMATITDNGTRISANTEEISKNGITLSQKAIELADKANAIAESAKTALEKISGFFNRGGSKPSLPKVEAHLDLLRQSDPAHWRTDLYGRFTLGKSFVEAGLYDAFESNKAILQLGDPLSKFADYRYGIYASKPGVGVDFRVAPRVSMRTDLFDINNPHFDFRTQFDFGNGFVGWLGLERIFDRNAIVVGVGIKK
jgi:phospholipid/cholesterol/gamma-HCH transport system substrate-binding protein